MRPLVRLRTSKSVFLCLVQQTPTSGSPGGLSQCKLLGLSTELKKWNPESDSKKDHRWSHARDLGKPIGL